MSPDPGDVVRGIPVYLAMWPPTTKLMLESNRVLERYILPVLIKRGLSLGERLTMR